MYGTFARVYDRLMRGVDYLGWADFYQSLLEEAAVPTGAHVVECACGTGGLTIPLSHHYRMTGIDQSADMLSIAARKAKDEGRQIAFVRQDMAKLCLHRPARAVLCTCDGPNYLLTQKRLDAFLRSAYRALSPGGALVMDLSSPYKLRTMLGDKTLTLQEEDIAYIWQNSWEEERACLQMALDIFVKAAGEHYERILEEQSQRAWTPAELSQALERAGFEKLRVYGDRRAMPPGEKELRLHLLARKPEDGKG